MGFLGWTIVGIIVIAVLGSAAKRGGEEAKRQVSIGKASGISTSDLAKHGALNSQLICPHCQTKGRVLTKMVKKKAGISGAKATGALLTGGLSILATGLSRKDILTEAFCTNCRSTWHF